MKIAKISTSLIDYPNHICSILYCIGCNLRCKWCYNSDLVILSKFPKPMPMGMVFSSLAGRAREFSKYVCITGGEPTIQRDLLSFVKFLNLGLEAKVKLDTNGTNPRLLKKLIPYLDYIAMDIKELPIKKEILESIMLIQDTGIDHHFRTTVVPGTVDEDLIKVISGLMKNDKYVLQQFTPSDNIIDPSFRNLEPYNRETLEEFRNILLKRCKEVSILG